MSKRGAVQSLRGGSGTSNSAATRAVTLREPGQRVGMVETEIQSPGIPMLCGMTEAEPGDTRTRYRWGEGTITQAASHGSGQRRHRARDERSLPRSSRSGSAFAHAGIALPVPPDTRRGAAASIDLALLRRSRHHCFVGDGATSGGVCRPSCPCCLSRARRVPTRRTCCRSAAPVLPSHGSAVRARASVPLRAGAGVAGLSWCRWHGDRRAR